MTTCGTNDFVVLSCALRVHFFPLGPDLSVGARELGVYDGGPPEGVWQGSVVMKDTQPLWDLFSLAKYRVWEG